MSDAVNSVLDYYITNYLNKSSSVTGSTSGSTSSAAVDSASGTQSFASLLAQSLSGSSTGLSSSLLTELAGGSSASSILSQLSSDSYGASLLSEVLNSGSSSSLISGSGSSALSSLLTGNSGTSLTSLISQLGSSSSSSDTAITSGVNGSSQSSLESIFRAAAQKYNVPVSLLEAVAKAESGFRTDAVSSAGAEGIMQLMPSTAESLGVSDPFDAEQNIMGGAKYLAQKLEQYNGDIDLTLASYNAGSGAVAKYGGVPPYKETQDYVAKVKSYMEEGVDVPEMTVTSSQAYSSTGSVDATTLDSETLKTLSDALSLELQMNLMKMEMNVLNTDDDDDSSYSYLSSLF